MIVDVSEKRALMRAQIYSSKRAFSKFGMVAQRSVGMLSQGRATARRAFPSLADTE
jgi:hypothetical protein